LCDQVYAHISRRKIKEKEAAFYTWSVKNKSTNKYNLRMVRTEFNEPTRLAWDGADILRC
jgi:hypothetical protein